MQSGPYVFETVGECLACEALIKLDIEVCKVGIRLLIRVLYCSDLDTLSPTASESDFDRETCASTSSDGEG